MSSTSVLIFNLLKTNLSPVFIPLPCRAGRSRRFDLFLWKKKNPCFAFFIDLAQIKEILLKRPKRIAIKVLKKTIFESLFAEFSPKRFQFNIVVE